MARRQLELSNEVAAELAGAQDAILKTLEEHLSADIFLRGNVVTLDGDAEAVQLAATVVRELSELVARGHEIGPATIESVSRVLDQAESPSKVLDEVVWRHRNLKVAPKSVNQKRYVDAIRRSTITFGIGPGRHRQDVPRDGDGDRRAVAPRGQPDHPHAPRGRGRRAARLPARRPDGEGRPVPAAAVRRAARHDGRRARLRAPRARRDRGRAARVHARPHAQRLVRDPRRGAEHVARADEDVPHAARLRLEDGRDRRHHADRPAARAEVRASSSSATSSTASTASSSSASAARTSCATSSCSGSSPPTTSTPRARRPSCGPADSAAGRREPAGGRGARRRPARRARSAAPACWPPRPPGWRTGTSRSTFVDAARRSRRSTPSTAARTARPTCSRSRSTAPGRSSGERELGDVVICPEHTEDLPRRSSTACCTSSAWTTRPTRARCSRCRRRSCRGSGADALGLRRARRPAERRQVDARQRDGRPQGRDRVRQAADDAARDPRRRDARRRADRADRPAGRAAPARRADAAHAAPRRAGAARGRRGAVRAQRRPGRRRARRRLDRRGAARRARAGRDRASTRSTARRTRAPSRRCRRPPSSALDADVFPVSARTGERRRAARRAPRGAAAARARSTSRPRRSPTSPSRSCSPSSCASRCSPARARRCRTRSRCRSRRSTTAAT